MLAQFNKLMTNNYHVFLKYFALHSYTSLFLYYLCVPKISLLSLLSWIRYKLEQAGDQREWRTIRRLLCTHSIVTTRIPLKDGRIISIRKASNPDAEQARVYSMLGIDWKNSFKTLKTEIKT